MTNFKKAILKGIPSEIPSKKNINLELNHAPRRKDILNKEEKRLALRNALRYFPEHMHPTLAPEFAQASSVCTNLYQLCTKFYYCDHVCPSWY